MYHSMAVIKEYSKKSSSPDPLEKYPKLQAHYSRIEATKNIADWLKKRPVTEY